jgi:hypothetical protein
LVYQALLGQAYANALRLIPVRNALTESNPGRCFSISSFGMKCSGAPRPFATLVYSSCQTRWLYNIIFLCYENKRAMRWMSQVLNYCSMKL